MPSYQHIMLPTSLSPNCYPLAVQALKLAEDCGARLSLLNVVNESSHKACTLVRQAAMKKLGDLGRALVVPTFDQYVRVGCLSKTITQLTEELAVDGIILGVNENKPTMKSNFVRSMIGLLKCDIIIMRY